VAFDGWTETAMGLGARDAGMADTELARFFPGGAPAMVEHFSAWADRCMAQALEGRDLATLRLRDRVALAVRVRFEALGPHREAVRRAIGHLALPVSGLRGARCLYHTVDAVWYAAGDRSADFSFYTKRALLAGVIAATTLYWLDDGSDDGAESWAFLDRRIADVMRLPRLRERCGWLARRLPDPFRILGAIRSAAP
jgi:ubiquinone biosynthesis protein COQ9